jgi:hypothetical protein
MLLQAAEHVGWLLAFTFKIPVSSLAMNSLLSAYDKCIRSTALPARFAQVENTSSAGSKRKRSKRQAAASLAQTTASAAACGIPQQELQQLQAFLQRVYRWRGWQGGQYHVTQAWHVTEAAAATAAAGSWQPDFDAKQLTNDNCDALLRVVDELFYGSKLLRRLTQKSEGGEGVTKKSDDGTAGSCYASQASTNAVAGGDHSSRVRKQRICCKVVKPNSPHETWLCYFDVSNVIYVNAWRWNKHQVTADNPVNCEGVVCSSRLQMLLHTLAHELVHAVVFHMFPEIDASSPAYLENDRHGPVFQLLNKQLYGHSSDALERVRVVECRH